MIIVIFQHDIKEFERNMTHTISGRVFGRVLHVESKHRTSASF